MPSFRFDISQQAADYVRASIKDMPGNPGQTILVESLNYDCSCILTVDIAGAEVETTAEGSIELRSNHPEAIEQIIKAGEDNFDEFLNKVTSESTNAYNGLDIIQTIRQDAVDQAFGEL